jgi:ubiquitin-like-conjugating enzyme ATG10
MLSSFPSLSENEFRDGCQALQRRCQGRLDDTDWVDIRWQQNVLTIKKLYHSPSAKDLQTGAKTDHPEDLASRLGDVDSEDEVLFWPMCFYEAADTSDQQALIRHSPSGCESIAVDLSILLSPTYQVPVLWFTAHEVPLHGPSGLDAVYHYLVPDLQKCGIRQVGILGGISMAV